MLGEKATRPGGAIRRIEGTTNDVYRVDCSIQLVFRKKLKASQTLESLERAGVNLGGV